MNYKRLICMLKENQRRVKASAVILIFQFIVSCYMPDGSIGCGGSDSGGTKGNIDYTNAVNSEDYIKVCRPPELKITNETIYTLPAVYLHKDENFTGEDIIAEGLASLENHEEILAHKSSYYVSFIRPATSESSIEYSVTSNEGLYFEECCVYKLRVLEYDFVFTTVREDNYDLIKNEDADDNQEYRGSQEDWSFEW